MSDEKVYRALEKLRDPKRLAFLETDQVVRFCLEGISPASVLDVGTGSGLFAEAFFRLGLVVTGVDIQEAMLEAARTYVPGASFHLASSENLPFGDKTFDLVFLGLVLHESEHPLSALQESGRVGTLRAGVLEWPYREEGFGPPLEHRIKPDHLQEMAAIAGFPRIKTIPLKYLNLYLLDR
ncbi:MAG: class I SAM-dependent methyltransferase [Deltaproteobacteria bacterium]|nr:class I SAM-dependent methyltransferase [Deltaproteobacteria bacterium]